MGISTDDSFSIAAPEFLWAGSQALAAHDYLLPPTVEALRHFHSTTVLDLGCGNGSCSAALYSQGFAVVGCDVSVSGIAFARQAHPEIEFFEHDVLHELAPPHIGHYDAVISLEVVEHLLQPRHLISTAYGALRPNGVLVISTPYHGFWKNLALAMANRFDDHWHPLRDFGHVKFFSKKTILPLVREAGFLIKGFVRVGRIPIFARSMIVIAVKPQ